jgi:hypothetical protein
MAPVRKTVALAIVCAVVAVCGAARSAELVSMEPGPVDFSGAIGGRAPADGRALQMILPGSHAWFVNDDFPASGYRVACDTPYLIVRSGAVEHRVCRIQDAPVVGPDFIATLKRIGYQYALSYPFGDLGNGRALVFWSDGGGDRGMAPAHQGFARISGVGWTDQFAPAARCEEGPNACVWRYFEHGDSFGAFINRFPPPDRETAARVFQQIGVDAAGQIVAGASVVIDDWLAGGDVQPMAAAMPLTTASGERR